jgi:hypothetical protein
MFQEKIFITNTAFFQKVLMTGDLLLNEMSGNLPCFYKANEMRALKKLNKFFLPH